MQSIKNIKINNHSVETFVIVSSTVVILLEVTLLISLIDEFLKYQDRRGSLLLVIFHCIAFIFGAVSSFCFSVIMIKKKMNSQETEAENERMVHVNYLRFYDILTFTYLNSAFIFTNGFFFHIVGTFELIFDTILFINFIVIRIWLVCFYNM